MAIGQPRGEKGKVPLYVYDPGIGRKRYIGSYSSREEALEAERTAKGRLGVRCIGNRRRGRRVEDWKDSLTADELFDCEQAEARDEKLVYFIQGISGGPIKIGMALRPDVRLADLQVGSPVRLAICHVMVGGPAKERELHEQFRDFRLWGEWFKPSAELIALCRAGDVAKTWAADTYDRGIRSERDKWKEYALELEAMLARVKDAIDIPLPPSVILSEVESEDAA